MELGRFEGTYPNFNRLECLTFELHKASMEIWVNRLPLVQIVLYNIQYHLGKKNSIIFTFCFSDNKSFSFVHVTRSPPPIIYIYSLKILSTLCSPNFHRNRIYTTAFGRHYTGTILTMWLLSLSPMKLENKY